MSNLEIISLVAFFAAIGLYLLKNKRHITYKNGIVIKRWIKGKEILDTIVEKNRKILPAIGILSIITGFLATFVSLYFIIQFSLNLQQAFAPALPSVSGISYPSPIIGVPFWYWVIGIFVIVFAHESMHGIFARLDKVRIKSYGIITFFVLPIGAFVDLDENQIKKLGTLKKLRLLSSGSFINIFLGIVFLLIALWFFSNFYEQQGVIFAETIKDTPAYNVSLNGTIFSVNGEETKTAQDLSRVLNGTRPASEITITTSKAEFKIKTVSRPDGQPGSYIGISGVSNSIDVKSNFGNYKPLVSWVYGLLLWLHVLNLGVGMANMLPIKPLDGGLFYEEIFKKYFGGRSKKMIKYVSIVVFLLFLFNLIGVPLIKYLMK